jgi:hypothetical protein
MFIFYFTIALHFMYFLLLMLSLILILWVMVLIYIFYFLCYSLWQNDTFFRNHELDYFLGILLFSFINMGFYVVLLDIWCHVVLCFQFSYSCFYFVLKSINVLFGSFINGYFNGFVTVWRFILPLSYVFSLLLILYNWSSMMFLEKKNYMVQVTNFFNGHFISNL